MVPIRDAGCRSRPMKCPFCGHADTQVVETRVAEDSDFYPPAAAMRTAKRFTTYPRPDVSYPTIVKKDGRRVEFDRARLLGSMNLAFAQASRQHRAGRWGHRGVSRRSCSTWVSAK